MPEDRAKSIEESIRAMKAISARQEFADAGFNFHAVANRCRACDYQYRIENGTMFVCGHIWRSLVDRFGVDKPPENGAFGNYPTIHGIRVVVDER